MKTQLLKLKAELKVLALNLKTTKQNTRTNQSEFDKKYPNAHVYEVYRSLREDKDFQQMRENNWTNCKNKYDLYREYRSKHIAYCLLRGRTLEQIEPKLKNENDPIHFSVRQRAMELVAKITKEVVSDGQPTISPK